MAGHQAVVLEDLPPGQSLVVASTNRRFCQTQAPSLSHVSPTATSQVAGHPTLPLIPEVKSRYEELEAATREQVKGLESRLEKLASTVEQTNAQVGSRLDQVAQQFTDMYSKVEEVSTLESRFEAMLSKFCTQTDTRLSRAEQAHADALKEIKAALDQSPKVRCVTGPAHP